MNDVSKKIIPPDALAAIAKLYAPSPEMVKALQSIAAAEKREQERLRKNLPRRIAELAREGAQFYPEHRDLIASMHEDFVACFVRLSSDPLVLGMVEAMLAIFVFAPPDSETKLKIGQEALKQFHSKGGHQSGQTRRNEALEGWLPHALQLAIEIRKENPSISRHNLAFEIKTRWALRLKCPESMLAKAVSEWEASGHLPKRISVIKK